MSVTVRITEGADSGQDQRIEMDPSAGQPRVGVGDHVRASRYEDVNGRVDYAFDDYDRGGSLGWLVLVTAVAVVAVARWRGFAALIGVGATMAGLGFFVMPALLAGENPLAVALVGSSALLFGVLYLAHGFSARTSAALVGTLVSLATCAILAVLATQFTHVTGLSDETNIGLQGFAPNVSIREVLICGFVIGALGALNDVTITQASAVWEISHSDPVAGVRTLYTRAMRIGRDHIASTVYTLVFAYAGTALPLLLILSLLDRSPLDVVSGDLLAVEVVRTAVGTLGLLVAVPVTTAVAALSAPRHITGLDDDMGQDDRL
jgi:uncharacterized membrane protein